MYNFFTLEYLLISPHVMAVCSYTTSGDQRQWLMPCSPADRLRDDNEEDGLMVSYIIPVVCLLDIEIEIFRIYYADFVQSEHYLGYMISHADISRSITRMCCGHVMPFAMRTWTAKPSRVKPPSNVFIVCQR